MMLGVFSALLTTSFTAAAAESSRVAAVVGNEIITSADLDKAAGRLQSNLARQAGRQGQIREEEIRLAALNRLIEDAIFKQILAKANLSLSEDGLDQQVQALLARNNIDEQTLAGELRLRGMSMEEYREELRMEILKRRLVEKVVTNRVVISEEQVREYLRAHAGENLSGEMHLYAIFLPVPGDDKLKSQMEESVHKLYQALLAGEDFSRLAAQVSRGPGAAQGGDMGRINTRDMLPLMRQAVQALAPGEISQVVKLPDSYVIFRRSDDDGARSSAAADGDQPAADSAEMRQARAILEEQATEQRFNEWMKQVRSSIYVKVME
jgi:peptidyl-prolyl cis-trans isomerase SurA